MPLRFHSNMRFLMLVLLIRCVQDVRPELDMGLFLLTQSNPVHGWIESMSNSVCDIFVHTFGHVSTDALQMPLI